MNEPKGERLLVWLRISNPSKWSIGFWASSGALLSAVFEIIMIEIDIGSAQYRARHHIIFYFLNQWEKNLFQVNSGNVHVPCSSKLILRLERIFSSKVMTLDNFYWLGGRAQWVIRFGVMRRPLFIVERTSENERKHQLSRIFIIIFFFLNKIQNLWTVWEFARRSAIRW